MLPNAALVVRTDCAGEYWDSAGHARIPSDTNLPFARPGSNSARHRTSPGRGSRERERAASDKAFQEAREAGIELLPRPLVDKPYDISLTATDGSVLRSPGLKGKVVLIDCWESTDGSYADRVSSLKRFTIGHRCDGFEVIGLNF